jgi:hypothetical protein
MDGLAVGRIVCYTVHEGDLNPTQKAHAGDSIAALVVKVNNEDGLVNLTLFPDWSNNGFFTYGSATPQPLGIAWKTSVEYSEEPAPGKWSWMPGERFLFGSNVILEENFSGFKLAGAKE